jgi:hypothetical protein
VNESTFERHYSVEELCELWAMSDDFVRRLFLHEPGVVHLLPPLPRAARLPNPFEFQSPWRCGYIGGCVRHNPRRDTRVSDGAAL